MDKTCPCGKVFFVKPYLLHRKKYCCKKCFYKYRTRPVGLVYQLVKENPTSFKKGQKPWNTGSGKPYFDKNTGYWNIGKDGIRLKYHRYVMEKHLGRKLSSEEVVHHIDNNPNNNKINNLYLFANKSEHLKHHWQTTRKWKKNTKGL